jgi:hypothetical protein
MSPFNIMMTVFVTIIAISAVIVGMMPSPPSRWHDAVVIKVCGNRPILQRTDGTMWLFYRRGSYRVLEPEKLC